MVVDQNNQDLYAISETDTDWHYIGNWNADFAGQDIAYIGIHSPWDAVIDLDYLKIWDGVEIPGSNADITAPVVSLSAPSDGYVTAGSTVYLDWTADADTVTFAVPDCSAVAKPVKSI